MKNSISRDGRGWQKLVLPLVLTNGVVWEILVPNLSPGALRAGYAQLRPTVIAAHCKVGNFRAALRQCLGKKMRLNCI